MRFELGKILCAINDRLATNSFVNNTYSVTEHHSDFIHYFVSFKYCVLLSYSEKNRMNRNTFQQMCLTFQQRIYHEDF